MSLWTTHSPQWFEIRYMEKHVSTNDDGTPQRIVLPALLIARWTDLSNLQEIPCKKRLKSLELILLYQFHSFADDFVVTINRKTCWKERSNLS